MPYIELPVWKNSVRYTSEKVILSKITISSEDDDWLRVVHEYSKLVSDFEKVNCFLVTHSTFLISTGMGPVYCMKSEWEIVYIESSYSGRLRSFPHATAGDLARRSKCSIFDSLFYAEKGPFSCMCWKKFIITDKRNLPSITKVRNSILCTKGVKWVFLDRVWSLDEYCNHTMSKSSWCTRYFLWHRFRLSYFCTCNVRLH